MAAGGTFANRLAEVADAKRVKGHFEMPHRVAVSCALALSADSSGGAVHSPDALAQNFLALAAPASALLHVVRHYTNNVTRGWCRLKWRVNMREWKARNPYRLFLNCAYRTKKPGHTPRIWCWSSWYNKNGAHGKEQAVTKILLYNLWLCFYDTRTHIRL